VPPVLPVLAELAPILPPVLDVVAELAPVAPQLLPGLSHRLRVARSVRVAQLPPVAAQLAPIAMDLARIATQLAPVSADFPAVLTNLPPIPAQLLDVVADLLRRRHRAQHPHHQARGRHREDPPHPPRMPDHRSILLISRVFAESCPRALSTPDETRRRDLTFTGRVPQGAPRQFFLAIEGLLL
jgi:hypothetical protein